MTDKLTAEEKQLVICGACDKEYDTYSQDRRCPHIKLSKVDRPDSSELREKIRGITHTGCTYHEKPICPIEGNHACLHCENMTDLIIALLDPDQIRKQERERIHKNTKYFLMSRYVVCSGDKYRLNQDDHKRLDEILEGRDLQDDENPYK